MVNKDIKRGLIQDEAMLLRANRRDCRNWITNVLVMGRSMCST